MLVHDDGESRLAVALDQSLGHEFDTWNLEPASTAWFGLALGPAELELDTSAVTRNEAGVGCIEVRGTQARLFTRGRAPWERVAMPIATTAGINTKSDRGLSFTRWRLIQRDHVGAPVELFTYDAERKAVGTGGAVGW